MNERIRELAEQATTKVAYYPDRCNGHPEYRYDFDKEKFAELIVRECIDIAYREGDNVAYLALHFGVRE